MELVNPEILGIIIIACLGVYLAYNKGRREGHYIGWCDGYEAAARDMYMDPEELARQSMEQ